MENAAGSGWKETEGNLAGLKVDCGRAAVGRSRIGRPKEIFFPGKAEIAQLPSVSHRRIVALHAREEGGGKKKTVQER